MEISANHLSRFLEAQQGTYEHALAEIKNGQKTGHWMWFIFPQLKGLGYSETSKFFAILNKEEAEAYLRHPILGARLIEICKALLSLKFADAERIFGAVDSLKLKSSMTLFASVDKSNPVFKQVLDKFFDRKQDETTIRLLKC